MRTLRAVIAIAVVAGFADGQASLFVPSQYPTIQSAIDAAAPFDQIVVAPGVYHESIFIDGKPVDLQGASRWTTTLVGVEGAALQSVVISVRNISSGFVTISGFALRAPTAGVYSAAGLFATDSALRLYSLDIQMATVDYAVGMVLSHCDVSGTDVDVHDHRATPVSGGIEMVGGRLQALRWNVSGNGLEPGAGESFFNADVNLTDCTLSAAPGAAQFGGCRVHLERCRFSNADANIHVVGCTEFLARNCSFSGSEGTLGPGQGFSAIDSPIHLVHCTIARNGTFAVNPTQGLGIRVVRGSLLLENSIVTENGGPDIELLNGATAVVQSSVVEGGFPGVNVVSGDARLDAGLYPLPGSAAFDLGDATLAGLPAEDLWGEPRIRYFAPDAGALEAMPPSTLGLTLDQPGGPGSLRIAIGSGRPWYPCLFLASTAEWNFGFLAGQGRFGGLHIPESEVFLEIETFAPPFVTVFNPAGVTSSVVSLPPGLTGLSLHAIAHEFDPVLLALSGRSPVRTVVLQ